MPDIRAYVICFESFVWEITVVLCGCIVVLLECTKFRSIRHVIDRLAELRQTCSPVTTHCGLSSVAHSQQYTRSLLNQLLYSILQLSLLTSTLHVGPADQLILYIYIYTYITTPMRQWYKGACSIFQNSCSHTFVSYHIHGNWHIAWDHLCMVSSLR